MAYDEGLAERIRGVLRERHDVVEKKMFGGLCFMVSGHMCVGIAKGNLMVRVGKAAYEKCLSLPHASEMDFTGKALKGMVYVDPVGLDHDADLGGWVQHGLNFVETLPPK